MDRLRIGVSNKGWETIMSYSKLLACLVAASIVSACSKSEAPADGAATTESASTELAANDGGIPISAPNDAAHAQYLEVRRLADTGDFIDANQAARKLTEDHPDFAGGWIMLGNTALSGPQFVQATTKAVELSEGGSDAQRLWSAINMTFVTNDSEEGLKLAKQLTETYPDSPRAWLIYSGYLGFQNQIEDARAAGAKVIELAPNQAIGHNNLGFSYLNNDPKDFAEAEKHFQHAAAIEPREDNILVNLGDVHRAGGDLEAARSDYSAALKLDSENATAAVKLGHVNSFLGNYDEARANYDMGIAAGQEGNKSTLANYRAFVSIHAGDAESAVAELKGELVRIDTLEMPEDQKVGGRNFILTNLADLCFHNELLDEAASAVEQLTATMAEAGRNSDDANFARQQEINAAFWRGKLAARQGNYDVARAEAETFASLVAGETNPRKLERYHELLGLIALREGDNESAIAHYRRANLSTSPGGGDVKNLYMLASALREEGLNEEAHDLLQQVANWNFNSVWFAMLRT
jgi:tetratricopeptide (TPR) repeat protein